MSEIREQGDIFFFCRPRVGVEEVRGLDTSSASSTCCRCSPAPALSFRRPSQIPIA
jgi:hypothetical protein